MVLCGVSTGCTVSFFLKKKNLIRICCCCETTSEAIILHFAYFSTFTAKEQVRSDVRPREFCGGRIDTSTGFSLSTPTIPCQYHFVSVRYFSSFQFYLYEEDKRAKTGDFPKKAMLLDQSSDHFMGKYLQLYHSFEG